MSDGVCGRVAAALWRAATLFDADFVWCRYVKPMYKALAAIDIAFARETYSRWCCCCGI